MRHIVLLLYVVIHDFALSYFVKDMKMRPRYYFAARFMHGRNISSESARLIGARGHLALAHTLLYQVVKPGSVVIDATCGTSNILN